MLVRVNVRSGEEVLVETVVMRSGGELKHGLVPMLGLNVVGGLTGSGKTVLADAIYLGNTWSIAKLTDSGHVVQRIIDEIGMRVYDVNYTACFREDEVGDEVCLQTVVKSNVAESVAFLRRGTRTELDEEMKNRLAYALAHIISLPHGLREAFFSTSQRRVAEIRELFTTWRMCEVQIFVPPFMLPDGEVPCYVKKLEVGIPPELRFEEVMVGWRRFLYAPSSLGEVMEALLKTLLEVAVRVRKTAAAHGVSLPPMLYIDDAFDGLDGSRLVKVVEFLNSGEASVYAVTHRLEAWQRARRGFVITYGTRAAELVEKPASFRIALVDMDEIRDREIFMDVCVKLAWPDRELCEREAA
jgi:hypothetical protein